jgi:hypothetical protein
MSEIKKRVYKRKKKIDATQQTEVIQQTEIKLNSMMQQTETPVMVDMMQQTETPVMVDMMQQTDEISNNCCIIL